MKRAREALDAGRRGRALDEEIVELLEVPLGVGHDERDPAGAQDPAQLGDRERPIGHVVQHVHRERHVEAVVGERDRLRVAHEQRTAAGRRNRALAAFPPTGRRRTPTRGARGAQHAEVQAVAAADVEDRLVAAQLGEVERAAPDVEDRALERVDRLARREVAGVGVLLLDVRSDRCRSGAHGRRSLR